MAESTYQRLTRDRMPRQFGVVTVSRVSLWLGGDHLLHVERNGFTETYKRFYFRDIQAITVQETNRRSVWNGILAVPLAVCLIGIIITSMPTANWGGMIAWSIFTILFLLPFVINNLRGTACACQLRTAVQTEKLGSLSRIRQTQKVLEKIRPLIIAAQGQINAEEVSARMREVASEAPPAENQPEKQEMPQTSLPPIISS
jgi:hypothetical protein